MKFLLKILSILGLLLLLVSILFFFFLTDPTPNTRIITLSNKTIKDDIEVTASIKSEHQYILYAPSEGIISNFNFELGESVSKNQLLATISKENKEELSDFQAETRLQNNVKQYTLEIQQSNEELGRISSAIKAGVLPRFKLEEVRSKLAQSKAKRRAADNELSSYQNDKRKKRAYQKKQTLIKALSNGIIIKKPTYEGQWIRRGDPILEIVSTDDLKISAMMSPKQVSKLTLDQQVVVSKKDSTKSWIEEIIRISPIISQEPNTKNLQEVTISLLNADGVNKSINEKVKIKIKLPEAESTGLSLPIEAVIHEETKFYILHVSKNDKASLTEIFNKQGFMSVLQQLKCQFTNCDTAFYGLSKKYILVGNSDLNRVQINENLSQNLKIIVPKSGMTENSLVILKD